MTSKQRKSRRSKVGMGALWLALFAAAAAAFVVFMVVAARVTVGILKFAFRR